MIFNLSKNKGEDEQRPMEEETIRRWREAAQRADQGIPAVKIDPEQEGFELGDEDVNFTSQVKKYKTKDIQLPAQKEVTVGAKAKASDPALSVEDDLQRRFGARIKEAIGAGTVIEGKLSFDAPVRIEGTLTGEVTSTSTLIVGEQGSIEAAIDVGSLVILGHVTGNVVAKDLVEIKSGGKLTADIKTKRIVIEEGGIFQGCCNRS